MILNVSLADLSFNSIEKVGRFFFLYTPGDVEFIVLWRGSLHISNTCSVCNFIMDATWPYHCHINKWLPVVTGGLYVERLPLSVHVIHGICGWLLYFHVFHPCTDALRDAVGLVKPAVSSSIWTPWKVTVYTHRAKVDCNCLTHLPYYFRHHLSSESKEIYSLL